MAASAASAAAPPPGGGGSGQNPWANGPGYYIYINSKYAESTLAKIGQSLSKLQELGVPIKGVSSRQDSYRFAYGKVKAPLAGNYPCGTVIGPDFFDARGLENAINIVILKVVETPHAVSATRSGIAPLVAQGFAVLRDLNLASVMSVNMANTFPANECAALKKQESNYLYIEGVCASRAAGRGAGTTLMDLVHHLASLSGFAGTKLSSLDYVIPYYFNKFSYRFRYSCEMESGIRTPAAAAAAAGKPSYNAEQLRALNVDVRNLSKINFHDEHPAEWKSILQKLTAAGFNAGMKAKDFQRVRSLRNVFKWWGDEEDDGDRHGDLLERLGFDDQGYYMYFCFKNNPTLGVYAAATQSPFTKVLLAAYRAEQGKHPQRRASTGVAKATKAAAHGGRKRRRKTKKRALKKRHRRKTHKHRRKRRHKHRRRRTKRHHRRKTRHRRR